MIDASRGLAAWLLTYLVHSTLLLGAAYALDGRLIRTSARRDLLWKVAAFGALFSATLQSAPFHVAGARSPLAYTIALPAASVPAPAIDVTDAVAPARATPPHASSEGVANTLRSDALRATYREPAPPSGEGVAPAVTRGTASARGIPMGWTAWLVMFWAVGAALCSARLAWRYARARRRFARRAPAHPDIAGAFTALCSRAGVRRTLRLSVSHAIVSPVALSGREICLPAALLPRLTAPQRDSMLAHELAHVERRDPAWLCAFAWLEAVVFLQPLVALARRRFQHASERLCDQWAVQQTERPLALAECLSEVARWLRGSAEPLPYASMANHGSALVERVQQVLSGAQEPMTVRRRTQFAAIALLVAFGVSAPLVSARPAADDAAPAAVRRQSRIADAVARMDAGTVRFAYQTRPSVCGTGVEQDGTRMFALQPGDGFLPARRADMLALYVYDRGALMQHEVGTDGGWTTPCNPGVARVDLQVRAGVVHVLEIAVSDPAPRLPAAHADLGVIPAAEAVAYLGDLARSGPDALAERAVVAAVLAHDGLDPSVLHSPAPPARSTRPTAPPKAEPQGDHAQDLRTVADLTQPMARRLAALARATRAGLTSGELIVYYERVPDRAMRVELIDWLAQREDAAVRAHLVRVVHDAAVWEEQQAALRALSRSSDPQARDFATRYMTKQWKPNDREQDWTQRINTAPDDIVHVSYAARPEACGSGIDRDGAGMFALMPTRDWAPAGRDGVADFYSFDPDDFTRLGLTPNDSWTKNCVKGPVHVQLGVRAGRITELRIVLGAPILALHATTDIGNVPTAEAVRYMIELAARAPAAIATKALLAAVLAGGDVTLYPSFIRIASDLARPDQVRQAALHWAAHDPAPGAREALRKAADQLPAGNAKALDLDLGNRNDSEATTGTAGAIRGGDLPTEAVLRITLDDRQPIVTRKRAITWAEERSLAPALLAALYDRVDDRELKRFLIERYGAYGDGATAANLIEIAGAGDVELAVLARNSLRTRANAKARSYR